MATRAAAISWGESLTASSIREAPGSCDRERTLRPPHQHSVISPAIERAALRRPDFDLQILLEGGLDLEAPGFQQRLRNVLGILVPACPFPQTRRPQVLVGGELVFAHHLLELGDRGGDRPNGFRLPPVWVSASLCH